ncbi:MAG: Transcriptional regulator YqjI [Phycisphaerales bacterium]|nr:Transcriptional regulator YqjI [Phycisphaerales bacterium]
MKHSRHGGPPHRGRHGHGHERGHGPEDGPPHHRGRGGPGRFFESAELRALILHFISDTPRHGYEIIKLIESLSAGAHVPSPGIVYPTLTMLEEMGLAVVTAEGTRKLYTITDGGKQELETHRATVDAILIRMQAAGDRHVSDRPAPILRAMENLKLVLRMRSAQLTPDQLNAVTDIIDSAAKQIERL